MEPKVLYPFLKKLIPMAITALIVLWLYKYYGALEYTFKNMPESHLKEEQGIRNTNNFYESKKDAVGDIIIYLADYCNQNSINMQVALETTLVEVLKRDWIKYESKSKGS